MRGDPPHPPPPLLRGRCCKLLRIGPEIVSAADLSRVEARHSGGWVEDYASWFEGRGAL